jgi:hypothetical protein
MRAYFAASCLLGGVVLGAAELRATPLRLAFDREGDGLAVAQVGVGLRTSATRTAALTLDVGGPVELAWLYWGGHDRHCAVDPVSHVCEISAEPFKDQVLLLDGLRITGQVLGSEFQPATGSGPILHVAYGADVTEQVRAKRSGRLTFRIADGDPASNLTDLDGAGLLVLYTDPDGPRARVLGFHGGDFAYGEDLAPGETTIVEAVTFAHGAAKGARQGEILLFVGGAEKGRPDRIEIRGKPGLTDRLDSSSGPEWDAERIPVTVPGRTLGTNVQIFSEPWGEFPDSFLWITAVLWLPQSEPEGCSADVWSARGDWTGTGIAPSQRVNNVFSAAIAYGDIGTVTLRTALRFQVGGGLLGTAKALVREGAAALLNAAHKDLEYPYTRNQVITQVNGALRTNDVAQMGELVTLLREANAAGCSRAGAREELDGGS